jgi:hypothetical protein
MPWKSLTSELTIPFAKMCVPLPLAHPVVIAVLIYNRDVDGEPISLDDVICQQILRAAESLQYVEVCESIIAGVGSSSANGYDVDGDTSTPDHMTSTSDPDVVQAHVISDHDRLLADGAGVAVAAVSTSVSNGQQMDSVAELRVVYLAMPTDTSCVAADSEATDHHFTLAVNDDDINNRVIGQHLVLDMMDDVSEGAEPSVGAEPL